MEFPSLPLSLLFIFFSLALSVYLHRRKADGSGKLPPGSFGWPFIGEAMEFFYGNHDKFIQDRMQKYSPEIFRTKILGEPTIVICGPAGNKFLFSNEQKLVTIWRPLPMQKIFRSYQATAPATIDPDSNLMRTPGFFMPEAIAKYLGKMDFTVQQHFKMYWEGRSEVKVYPLSKNFTLTLSCGYFLGIKDPERITRLVHKFDDVSIGMHSIPINFPGTVFFRAKKAAMAIRKELLQVIREKKAETESGALTQDVLSHLILATHPITGKLMPEAEIADKMMGLVVAGYSTVAIAITFLMKYIGERPDIYDKVLEEQQQIDSAKGSGEPLDWDDIQKMTYSWNVVNEVLRLVPPLQGTFREAITNFTYAGYTIPKGWKIYWTASSTNKHPKYFPDPEKFDPSRYGEGNPLIPYTFVPFGGGPRMCPGKQYARFTILTFLHNVVKKFKWELLFSNEKIKGHMMPSPARGLPVRLQQH